jgi:subtilisin family serine protease
VMRSYPLGLLKVLLLLQLMFRFENGSATTTARAVATVAASTYKKGGDDNPAPRRRRSHRKLENRPSTEVIPDAYIILLNNDDTVRNDNDAAAITSTPEAIAKEYGITIEHIYQHAIQGFSSRCVEADILDLMLEDSRIWAVGEDGNLEMEHETDEQHDNDLAAEDGNTDTATAAATASSFQMQQSAAPEHLDQIDQSMDGRYSYTYTGAGVHIYIIDAGILASHEDFGGRVVTPCFDEIGPCNTDTDSHGTHIASIAGKFFDFPYAY